MAGEDAAAAAAAAGAAAVKKPLKEEEEEDDDELDNVPLALSRPKKAGNATASKVKKEEDDDDEEDDLPISHSRAKKGNDKQKGTMNSNTKASKAKKEADSDYDDFMPISHKKKVGAGASNAKASKVKKLKDEDLEDLKEDKKRKKRGGVKEEAIVPVKGDKVKKEKKVYELPGQKHDPPAERDPLRIFYESLYEQVPTSEMAAIWLMEWGLLPLDVARKVYEKKQGQKFKSPVKTIVSKRKPTPTKKTPASSAMKSVSATKSTGKPTSQKKRKASGESEDDEDGDFVVPKAKTKRQKASS